MAFGPASDAQGRIPIGNIIPVGVYATGPNGQVSGTASENVALSKNNVTERGTLKRLEVAGFTLTERAGAPDPTALAGDSGAFLSAIGAMAAGGVAANQHLIPANFGPGRGRWTQADVDALDIKVDEQGDSVAPSAGVLQTVASPYLFEKTLVGADVRVVICNPSIDTGGGAQLNVRALRVTLEWRPGALR